MTHLPTLRHVQALVGHRLIYGEPKPAPWKTLHRWQVSGREALVVLSAVLPYLVTKHEQAEVALAYGRTMGVTVRGRLTDEQRTKRQLLWARMRRLNQKGTWA